ncbi:hypothetical protein [Flavobacterium difficile]|uniref:Lipoprotein n=1 Tax=Flavobacterium difficile TaxID=2709659 RepID=A0ABX0I6H4_9FLAO|nr:hypothetical protein [Flavobacterium difficile]NHM02736.1 hypothetical protein [Flavobacterium difficile]
MKKIGIIAFFAFLSLISCKEEKETNNTTKKVVSDLFVVKLNVQGKKDDTFHVYYTEDKSLNFDEKKTVWAEFSNVSGNNLEVQYKLPKDVLPNQLRLDFGINNPDGVVIDKIDISYLGKKFELKGKEISNYFRPNEFCTSYDSITNKYKPLKKGDNISLFPLEKLPTELEKLFK